MCTTASLLFACALIAVATNTLLAPPVAATTVVCPQVPANDPSPRFCARNSFGQFDITRTEFENWNCNHPANLYTAVSQIACAPGPTATTCMPETCDHMGPTVCARLPGRSTQFPGAFTTAVFGNQCHLTLYNCRNPMQQYVAANPQPAAGQACTSVGR